LPYGARVGTSSLRRRAELLALRPDIKISDVRGNIDTRLKKLRDGGYGAIILAAAGLNRLDPAMIETTGHAFDEHDFVPAPGQGALAIEARENDEDVLPILKAVEDPASRAEITAERATMSALNAGCSTPLGARAVVRQESIELWAVVLSPDGRRRVFVEARGSVSEAEALGKQVAQELLDMGAGELLA
jgi:hydroxymethylbilane synthase